MDYIFKKLKLSDVYVNSPAATAHSSSSSVAKNGDKATTEMTSTDKTVDESSQFSTALDTMDRFLDNDSNLLVQSLVSLESKTNISRRYLARAFLLLFAGYFLFSNSVIDLVTHALMFLYPSYRSYLMLQNENISKEDLTDILKYWIFIGLFSTLDYVFGALIPFGSVIRLFFIVQCTLPRKSPALDFAMSHLVTPVFRYLEQNENIRQVNSYLQSLSTNLKSIEHSHQE